VDWFERRWTRFRLRLRFEIRHADGLHPLINYALLTLFLVGVLAVAAYAIAAR
jgi:hypothetical protein